MGCGIAIAGANGSGKTTLGSCLAARLGYVHLDAETYFFEDSELPYARPRPREEARALLLADLKAHERFVYSAVNCDLGSAANAMYHCAVYLEAPLAVRLERIEQRSVRRFGSRARKGGDLYGREQRFSQFVATRTMEQTEAWLRSLTCPVLRLDGTESAERNARRICESALFLDIPLKIPLDEQAGDCYYYND